jgi:putative addiction module antidote
MRFSLKVIQVGNSLGVTLPREMLADLQLQKGDVLTVTSTPGGYRLTPHNPEVERQIDAGRQIMRQYRETLRALAAE